LSALIRNQTVALCLCIDARLSGDVTCALQEKKQQLHLKE